MGDINGVKGKGVVINSLSGREGERLIEVMVIRNKMVKREGIIRGSS